MFLKVDKKTQVTDIKKYYGLNEGLKFKFR